LDVEVGGGELLARNRPVIDRMDAVDTVSSRGAVENALWMMFVTAWN
jgi:hypothetical protein